MAHGSLVFFNFKISYEQRCVQWNGNAYIVAALVAFVFCNLTPPLLFLLMSEENIVMVQVTTCTQSYTCKIQTNN